MIKIHKFFLIILFIMGNTALANEKIRISQFDKDGIQGWEKHSFKGNTLYTSVNDEEKGQVLKAYSHNSASGLIMKKRIDLAQTPFLNWHWKIENTLDRLAETMKEGDDFAARIYIIVDGGVFFWNTLALNYVWSSTMKKSSHWTNPFTSNAKMISIESGNKLSKKWVQEKRNVRDDLRIAYQKDIRIIDAIAIMTDTDNSGQSATAYFHNLYFSKD